MKPIFALYALYHEMYNKSIKSRIVIHDSGLKMHNKSRKSLNVMLREPSAWLGADSFGATRNLVVASGAISLNRGR